MRKVLMSLLFGIFILMGQSFAQTPPAPAPAAPAAPAAAAPVATKTVHHHDPLHKAMHDLRLAKENLLRLGSSQDADAHRAKAIASIDEALAQLKDALDSDKK